MTCVRRQWEIQCQPHLSPSDRRAVYSAGTCIHVFMIDYAHFTFSDTIWPLSLSTNFGTQIKGYTEKLPYIAQDTRPCKAAPHLNLKDGGRKIVAV